MDIGQVNTLCYTKSEFRENPIIGELLEIEMGKKYEEKSCHVGCWFSHFDWV
jgi:hypothetical protein